MNTQTLSCWLSANIFKLSSLFLVLLFSLQFSARAQSWETVGEDDNNQASFTYIASASIVKSPGNMLYMPFIDDLTKRASVRRYTGTAWEQVGQTAVSDTVTNIVSLAFDGNIPYVAYAGNELVIKKFDGTNWVTVVSEQLTDRVSMLSVNIVNSIPYVLYKIADANRSLVFKKFEDGLFTTISTTDITRGATDVYNYSIAFDGVTPYIAYKDLLIGRSYVKKYNGAQWVDVGSYSELAASSTMQLKINKGIPYLASWNYDTKPSVKYFDGNRWNFLGGTEVSNTSAVKMTLGFDNDTPYLLALGGNSSQTHLYKYTNSKWVQVGDAFDAKPDPQTSALALEFINNIPYAFSLDSYLSYGKLRRYNGTGWDVLESKGFSLGNASVILDVKTDKNKVPYVLYNDYTNPGKATLARYNGTAWETVGQPGFTATNSIYFASLGFSAGNYPMVLYYGGGENLQKVYLSKFNGTAWQTDNNATLVFANSAYGIVVALDDDLPYVLYNDTDIQGKLTLKKYNGTTWVNAGAGGFSDAEANFSELKFSNHVPYVAYSDTYGTKIKVMQLYAGFEWWKVGNDINAQLNANFISLAFSSTGAPYIAHSGWENHNISVLKFTGTTWQQLGPSFSGTRPEAKPSIFITEGIKPILTFNDANANGRVSSYKFNGTNWMQIGTPGFTAYETMPKTFVYNNKLHAVYAINKLYHKYFNGQFDVAAPTVQASNVKISALSANEATISWKKGNGTARAVFVKNGSYVSNSPADGVPYTANTTFKSGSQLGSTSWYCVYNGTDTLVTIKGLSLGFIYEVLVFEYNGEKYDEKYLNTTIVNRTNFTTVIAPTVINDGQWTWAGGSGQRIAAVYGQIGVEAASNTPGARIQPGTWTDKQGNLWLMGGITSTGRFSSDLWKYNTQSGNWVWVSNNPGPASKYGVKGVAAITNSPGWRSSPHTWVDSQGNLWMMGGEGIDESGAQGTLNDVWKYDIATGLWAWMAGTKLRDKYASHGTKNVANALNNPGGRMKGVTWTDNQNGLWLMGGQSQATNTYVWNDVWRFDTQTLLWTWVGGSISANQSGLYGVKNRPNAVNMPGSRTGAVCWQDASGDVWLMGGAGYGGGYLHSYLNDLWKFDMTTKIWTWVAGSKTSAPTGNFGAKNVPSANNEPPGRANAVNWIDNTGNLWIFGGAGVVQGPNYGNLNDLWMYNTKTANWVWVHGSNTISATGTYNSYRLPSETGTPAARYNAAKWRDKNGNFWIYGGQGNITTTAVDAVGDLWVFKPEIAGPSLNAQNITVTDIGFTHAKISWKKGNGDNRVVFIKKGNYGTVTLNNMTSYTADAEFGKSQVNSTDWYCIYNGPDSIATVSNLSPNTRYQVFVAEYTGNAGQELYNSQSVTGNPENFSTSLALTSLTPSKGTLSPAFTPSGLNYTLNMPLGSTLIQFTPAIDTNAVIKIQDKVVANGKLSDSISVKYGTNIIPITVTVGEQTTTYNVTVKVGLFAPQINFAALPVKTYGDAAFEPVATSDNTGVPVVFASNDNQVAQIVNGKIKVIRDGTVRITASQIAGNGYDAAVSVTQTFTVNKAQLIVKAKDKNRIYGTGNGTLTFTYTGFVNGDTQAKLSGGLPVATTNATTSSPVGTYEITPVVKNSHFYELVVEPGTLTVTKARLTVTTNAATRFYGAANPVIVLKYTGFVNNDGASKLMVRPTALIQADALSVPGRYAVTVDGGEAQNYDFTYVPGTLTINKANLFITAKSRLITYGDVFPSLVLTYSGFVNGEKAEQAFNTMPVVTTTASPSSPAGNYPITVSGAASSKYVLYYTNGTFTINKAVLRVTARNQTREQYQSNPEFTLRYSGFINGDTESMLRTIPQGYTAATENSPVGQYAINASGGYSPYYTFNYTAGVLTVTKATTPSFARTSSAPDDIVVHAAVSPNGDGQNDYWQIENIEKYTENQVMILTNAGTLVYEAKGYDNYNKRFEGYSSGGRVKQQPGTYMYVINYVANGEQKKKTGYLVLK